MKRMSETLNFKKGQYCIIYPRSSVLKDQNTLENDYEIQEWARLLSASYEDGGCNIKV